MGKMTFRKYRDHAMLIKYDSEETEECVYVPAEYEGLPVKSIGDGAFRGSHLRLVVLPETMECIGYSAFEGVYELQCIGVGEPTTTGNLPTHSVFPRSIRRLESACFKNTSLENITFTGGTVTIGDHVFSGCRKLQGVVFFQSTGVFEGESAFAFSGVQYIDMPLGELSYLPMKMFEGCRRLEKVRFKDLDAVEYDCFSGCEQLRVIVLLDGEHTLPAGRGAFQGCKNLLHGGKFLRTAYDALLAMGDDIYDVVHKFEREHKDFSSVNAIVCKHRVEKMLEELSQDSFLNYRDTVLISYLGTNYVNDEYWDYHFRFSLYVKQEILEKFQYIREFSSVKIWDLPSFDAIRLSMFLVKPDAMEFSWKEKGSFFLSEIAGRAFEADPQGIALELLYRYLAFQMGYIPFDQEMHIESKYEPDGSSFHRSEFGVDENKIHFLKYGILSNRVPRYQEVCKVFNKLKIEEE